MIACGFDFETTGLPLHPNAKMKLQPRVIEAGFCLFNDKDEILEEHNFMINPEQPLEPIITKITGITDEDLADKPKFIQVWPQMRDIMQKADLLVAHNAPFDVYLLQLELNRHDITTFVWPKHTLCTAQCYQEAWGRRPKLQQLYERVMGEPMNQTHRALEDVQGMVKIILKERLLDLYKGIC
jgi:DNA polymerase III epsilon subunit-like protein